MLRDRITQQRWMAAAALGVALAFVWLAVTPSDAGANSVSDKLKRQIRVMEEVVDEVLVESPYLLVYSSDPTHGFYIDEFGAIFSFEASLVGNKWDFAKGLAFLDNLHIEKEDGKTVIWIGEGEGEEGEKKIEIITEGRDAKEIEHEVQKKIEKKEISKKDLAEMKEEKEKSEAECYASGKDELIEGLVDYGETLTGLRDDQWVAITAFLTNADLFKKNEISRLVLKVRVRDLRAHASGSLSRENLVSRVMVEEY